MNLLNKKSRLKKPDFSDFAPSLKVFIFIENWFNSSNGFDCNLNHVWKMSVGERYHFEPFNEKLYPSRRPKDPRFVPSLLAN